MSAGGFSLGDLAPGFTLPDTDGAPHALDLGEATATVVVFTCNHCPYALAWHDRILDVARDYAGRGVKILLINPNDAERYPRDSAQAMRERVVRDGGWPWAYLRDETQAVAHAWGALTTPDVFVLDGELALRYRGAPDSDHDDPGKSATWLRDALDAVLAGAEPALAATDPLGCSIKWKPA